MEESERKPPLGLDGEEMPYSINIQVGSVSGRFFNIPKIVDRIRRMRKENPKGFEDEMEKARARHRARDRGTSP